MSKTKTPKQIQNEAEREAKKLIKGETKPPKAQAPKISKPKNMPALADKKPTKRKTKPTKREIYEKKRARLEKRVIMQVQEGATHGFALEDPNVLDKLTKTVRTEKQLKVLQKEFSPSNVRRMLHYNVTKIRSGINLNGKPIKTPIKSNLTLQQLNTEKGRATAINKMLSYKKPVKMKIKDKTGKERTVTKMVHITSRAESSRIYSILSSIGMPYSSLTEGVEYDNEYFKLEAGWKKNSIAQFIKFKKLPKALTIQADLQALAESAFSQDELYQEYIKQKAYTQVSDMDDNVINQIGDYLDASILLALLFKYLPPSEVADTYNEITQAVHTAKAFDRQHLIHMIENGRDPADILDYIENVMKFSFKNSRK